DRRENPAGHRRSAVPHGKGRLWHLPGLRRSDFAGAAGSDSLDPRLHRVQAEAELMKPNTDLQILGDCHREKLTLRERHVAVARLVRDYEFNNTYQYLIAREDVHLSWLEAAIADLGGTPGTVNEPALAPLGKKES